MTRLPTVSRTSRRRAGMVTAGLTALLVGAGAVGAIKANAAAECQVTYEVLGQWDDVFQATITVTNLGDAVNGWQLAWTFPAGQRVTQAWNATIAESGGVTTATDLGYNANIPTNASLLFGFMGSSSGSNTNPTAFALNGVTCSSGSSGGPSTPPPSDPPPTGDAMATVAAMEPGWNLGNSLDAVPNETAWGNPPATKELFTAVRAAGYRSVRIPVTWSDHQGPAPDYPIDPAYLSRVKEVVDGALANDLYVLLNVHHDSWQWISSMSTDHDGVLNRFNLTWTQIATTFKDEPTKLTFESVNEPQFTDTTDAESDQLIDKLNRSFHSIVRGSGGNNATRLLVLPNTKGLQPLADTITSLQDPNLAATVHYYGFWPFSVNIAGRTTFDAETKQDMANWIEQMSNTFVAKGIPFIAGEYGVLSYDYTRPNVLELGEVKKFFEEFGYQARTKQITTMLWDAGSFLERDTLQWRDPELMAQISSSWTTRSGTASSDMVFLPKSGEITDKTLVLNLNGTTFAGLRQGTTDLVDGTDYTVVGDQLTLTAAALTRLAGDRAYGVNATLQAQFSQGVPWRIDVITSDPPVLSDVTGTTSSVAIPTTFRGDRLATMEAAYADGSAAGPADWTTYKELGVCCKIDYAGEMITLTSDFFEEVEDGSRVTLTFHFCSGATVTYHVTRTGTSVRGAAGLSAG